MRMVNIKMFLFKVILYTKVRLRPTSFQPLFLPGLFRIQVCMSALWEEVPMPHVDVQDVVENGYPLGCRDESKLDL